MNEEIKKILDYLKNNTFIPDETKRKYKILHRDEVNRLLNYITNLQIDNKFLNNYIDSYRNVSIANKTLEKENQKLKNNMSGITMEEYTRALNNYQELKNTNEEHRKINGDLRKENQKLVKVIDETAEELEQVIWDELNKNDSGWGDIGFYPITQKLSKIYFKLTELKGGSKQ